MLSSLLINRNSRESWLLFSLERIEVTNETTITGPGENGPGNDSRLELAIAAWLDAKSKRSNSTKKLVAYRDTLASFRKTLLSAGLDLDSPDAVGVALAIQGWAGQPASVSTTVPDQVVVENGAVS